MTSKSMMIYIIKRILLSLPMILLVITLTWVFAQFMPGDPSSNFPLTTPQHVIDAYREEFGLNDSLLIQLGRYLLNFFQGDLGISAAVFPGEPVLEILKKMIPRTLELVLIPIILIPILGVKTGVISAKKRNKIADYFIRTIAVIGVAIPSFWFAMLLQYFFGYILPNWTGGMLSLPTYGFKSASYGDPPVVTGMRMIDCILSNNQILLMDTIKHLILPILCSTFLAFASITRQTRSSMLEILEQDYIRTARAKGCNEEDVFNKHALRNAMIPTMTIIISNSFGMLAGSALIELTFNYKALGFSMVQAIRFNDYWMICGIVGFVSILVIVGNLVADIAYTIIDPRIMYN